MSGNTEGNATTAAATDLVVTPGGFRRGSMVHHIEGGAIVDGTGNHFSKVDRAGNRLLDLGALDTAKQVAGRPLMPANVAPGTAKVPGIPDTGWITYASWTENAEPLTSFTTTFVVPPPPSTNSGQVVFLFPGIQNSTMIYQPVLQWGVSAAGGGAYWAVASWYADGQSGQSFHSSLVPVSPGQVLTGVMTETGSSSSGYSYNCEFAGIAGTGLPVTNVQQLTWCVQTLECYGLQQASDYPMTTGTAMSKIEIEAGGEPLAPAWSPTNSFTDAGTHAVVVSDASPGGDVDLYFNNTPGLIGQVVLTDSSTNAPALASMNGLLYLAWTGTGNNELNVSCSADNGVTFGGKATSSDTSRQAPALCVNEGNLFIGWTGVGNNELNVSKVGLYGATVTGFAGKVTLAETSPYAPALASLNGMLFIAWTGVGNNNLNIAASADNGASFGNTYTSAQASTAAPALTVQNGILYVAWKGNGNDNLNVGHVAVSGGVVSAITNVATLSDTSANPAALASNGALHLSWKGDGNNNLNVERSADDGHSFGSKFTSNETSTEAPGLGSLNGSIFIAWIGVGNGSLNVARVAR